MNDIEKIKKKIKKLLALAKSPNPNEAASALKIAQDLMAEYKICTSDVNTIEIGSKTTNTHSGYKPPRYETCLFENIASAYGCSILHCSRRDKYYWRFIGLEHRAEISAYIGQILLRKLRSARSKYYKNLYRVRLKSRRIQRADDFCLAWVYAVTDKLTEFANTSKEEKTAISLYVEKNHPNIGELKTINRSFGNAGDYFFGHKAGSGVELQHGVGVSPNKSLLLGA